MFYIYISLLLLPLFIVINVTLQFSINFIVICIYKIILCICMRVCVWVYVYIQIYIYMKWVLLCFAKQSPKLDFTLFCVCVALGCKAKIIQNVIVMIRWFRQDKTRGAKKKHGLYGQLDGAASSVESLLLQPRSGYGIWRFQLQKKRERKSSVKRMRMRLALNCWMQNWTNGQCANSAFAYSPLH